MALVGPAWVHGRAKRRCINYKFKIFIHRRDCCVLLAAEARASSADTRQNYLALPPAVQAVRSGSRADHGAMASARHCSRFRPRTAGKGEGPLTGATWRGHADIMSTSATWTHQCHVDTDRAVPGSGK